MFKKSFIAVTLLTISHFTYANTIECPPKLTVTETAAAAADWISSQASTVKVLNNWSIYEGSLGDTQYQQAPSESAEKNGKLKQTWDFDSKHEYWIRCNYAETSTTLMKKIPNTIKQCHMTFKLDKQHNTIDQEDMICN